MAGEAIEIAALRTNLRSITSAVQGNLQWFADGLIEKAFIAPGSASGILETHGVTPAEKAGKLLNSVFTKIETSKEKRRWFNEFLAIFSDKVYEELVKTLTENASGGGGGGDVKVATPPTLPLLDSLPFKGGKLRIIQKCCPNYPTLGIHLLNDDDGAEVKRIEMEKNFKPEPTMKAIFEEWLNTRKDCSWSIFITCLQKCNLNKLAKDVKDALIENRISF
jgi:hypothetical protein